jgi:hypothetical protein
MKKYIFPLLLIGSFAFTQTKPDDYLSIKNIDEVRKKCIEKDNEIANLKKEIQHLNNNKNETFLNKSDSIIKLKQLVKDINSVFLRDIFEEKYIKNERYFIDTDLVSEKEDDTQKFKNSNVIINSIKIEEKDPLFIKMCTKASEFNENYLTLFEIRKNVLNQKYDSEKVNQAIKDIDNLPALENNSKLFLTKNKIRNYLEKYLQRTCELKKILISIEPNPDKDVKKKLYTTLQNKEEFKTYPYLIQVIVKVKNDVNNYSKNDLQPCEEEVKEIVPVKVEESKTENNK